MYEAEIEGLLRLENAREIPVSNLATHVLNLVAALRDAELRVELAEAHRDAAAARIDQVRDMLRRRDTGSPTASAILKELAEIVGGCGRPMG